MALFRNNSPMSRLTKRFLTRLGYSLHSSCQLSSAVVPYHRNYSSMHPTAKAGYQDASKYDQHRPDYNDECVDAVIGIGGLLNTKSKLAAYAQTHPCVLELGAGTGKFTKKFLKRCTQDVRFVAVDPNHVFLERLRQKNLPIEIMPSTASNIALANGTVDVAQSFHWFADRESLAEIHRVMKTGAKFVALWILPNYRLPWLGNLHDYLNETYRQLNTPTPRSYEWKEAFKDSLDLFTPLHEPHVCISRITFTMKEFLSHFLTLSLFASQTDTERKTSKKRFLEIANAIPDFKNNCVIEISFHTEIYWVSKI